MYISRITEKSLGESLKNMKVLIILGARQVGKTTLVKKMLGDSNTVFFNFDIEADVSRFFSVSALPPVDAVRSLGNPKFIVIDEAHKKPDSFRVVKGWYDAEITPKIILLGSSSADIADYSAESLAGRNEKLYLPALTFKEIIYSQSWYSDQFSDDHITNHFGSQVSELLMQNIIFGSYPEVVVSADKPSLLMNLSSDYLLKDVLQLGLVKDPDTLHKLVLLLAHQIGSEMSVNELATSLGISRLTVERYLGLLERTFVIFRLPAWSTNPRKEITKSQKIYFWDTGIRNAVINDFSMNESRSDIGFLWENWVVAECAKQNLLNGKLSNIYFWRSRSSGEVDLISKKGDEVKAYEIKWSKKVGRSKVFENQYNIKISVIERSRPMITF